ncbi:MAG: 50S ribosomal protein L23 [Candidatus Hydrogenedentes bacterium]|nr:50S ribosomal protein L23 [Candidatus Hydrogenedentota bacterium]
MKAKHAYHVLWAPVLSEESTIQTESKNKYTFKVDPRANKQEIRDAVERQWPEIQVVAVNTMNYRGKVSGRRSQGIPGRRASWKKAIVTLREGDTIDLI